MTIPVVSITDLYHPPEDPGDNFDLIMPYGLPEIDLRAVILDALDHKRDLVDGGVPGFPGPRDPGIIPVTQLNAIFGVKVPFAMCPFTRMRSLDDQMYDAAAVQQFGIDLLLDVLASSNEPVHLMSFGSARPLAIAFNRDPDLMRSKVARIHLSAGTTTPTYMEWNVVQDPLAMIRIVSSGLPLALYPCATVESCYAYDQHNTFYSLSDLRWIADMDPRLRRYLGYALGRSSRLDYLRVLDEDLPPDVMETVYSRSHSIWETAAWLEVSGRRLVRHSDGRHRIIPSSDVGPGDVVIRGDQLPCTTTTHESGLFSFQLADRPTGTTIFRRDDPYYYEEAMTEALPALYQSFRPTALLST